MPDNPRAMIAQFYVKRIEGIEAKTHMVSNVSKYMDPLSSGFLCIDWLFNGGIYNVFASVNGLEGAGKTVLQNHMIASGVRQNLLFNANIDAESTMNEEFATAMFAQLGISFPSLDSMPNKPYRYYKENVIETIFDYIHGLLKTLPQKIWIPDANSWAYVFNKRDPEDAKKMEAYGLKPEAALSRTDKFICLTDYSGIEGGFYLDSFAAMVTNSDDEEDQKGKRRAAEAAAFSEHLRRVSARLSNRGCLMFGVNQLGQTPGQVYGDQYYEKGGNALKYFSAQRARFTTRGSGFPGNDAAYHKELKTMAEPSVIVPGSYDFYDYKHIKNVKNKVGNPKKETWVRVWVSDHNGHAHGFDPAFDLFNYLLETKQLIKNKRKLKFALRKSVGNNRAALLNALPDFAESDLKLLTLSEVFPSRELIQKALKAMKLEKTVGLREALFNQVRTDKWVLALKTTTKAKPEVDLEDNETEY